MIDNNKVVEILRSIQDPSTGQDLIAMKMITELRINGNTIGFKLGTSTKDQEVRSALYQKIHAALTEVYPEANVDIHFLDQASSGNPLPQVQNIIAVGSGKGGVGKSTVAVNIATSLKNQGYTVGLLDADLYGPSIPTMLGMQGRRPKVEKLYGRNVIVPLEKDGLYMISIGFIIEPEQAVVLRGPRLGGIIKQFIKECKWPKLDFLIIDLPPGTGDIQLTMVQTIPISGAVMVTTPQEVSVIDAVKAMNMFRLENINVPILGVVENMSWFTPAELPDNKYRIFGQGGGKKLAQEGNTILLGQLPIVMSIRESGDKGIPAVNNANEEAKIEFAKISQNLIRQLNIRNEMLAPTSIVQMNQ